ncbi:hypothetical protein [Treponema berlinense]|uniref:hypothetical protein n=1 Tax=Treponema berlinense TaxID=225004 RepID=UPI002355B4E0|nr:hypothetical protein [Treponema berlinense]
MKSTRFVFGRALAVLCALLFVSFGFMSCQQEDDDNGLPDGVYELSDNSALIGTWVNSYSGGTSVYKITSSTFDNSGTSSYNGTTSTYDSYAGNNLVVSYTNDEATSGYIYIKYTRAYCSTHSDPTTYTYIYDEDAADVGKWYAIAFKELTASSVSLSGAYGTVSSTSTLEEAISTFTIANGYFSTYSECVKQ